MRQNTALVILLDANFYADVAGVQAALKLEALDCAAHARACQVSAPTVRAARRVADGWRMCMHAVVAGCLSVLTDGGTRCRPSWAAVFCGVHSFTAAYLLLFMR